MLEPARSQIAAIWTARVIMKALKGSVTRFMYWPVMEIFMKSGTGRATSISQPSTKPVCTREYDTEGLAYDAANHRLLIACKEFPGKDLKGYKAIYAFDLKQKRLLPEPTFKIDPCPGQGGSQKWPCH